MLAQADPEEAARMEELAQHTVDQRWAQYEEMATRSAADFADDAQKARTRPDQSPEMAYPRGPSPYTR
jgi:pyruvate-ferredoxin/flavodoxin oxidoreductase